METDDQISVSLSNSSVAIASGDQLQVDDIPAIIWVADEPGHKVNITINNAGWISSSASNSFALDGDASLIYGNLTFNNKKNGEIDAGMDFSDLTGSATVKIVNKGSLSDEDGNSALRLSDEGASFSIVNDVSGVIGGDGTGEAINNASNTVIDNYGAIGVNGEERVLKAEAARAIGFFAATAIDLGDGTNDVINNHAGGYIEGGTSAIRGSMGNDVTISNEAGALIHATDGAAIQFTALARLKDVARDSSHGILTIDNAGEIMGNSRPNLENVKAVSELTMIREFASAGAIISLGRVDLINSGLITEASILPTGHGENFSTAIGVGGGKIENHGTIIGVNIAIEAVGTTVTSDPATRAASPVMSGDRAALSISNDGLIQGGPSGAIVLLGTENDKLTNSGHIVGNVDMGDGNDFVKLSGASDIDGNILLGAGNDLFRGSAADEDIYGGKGADRMTGGGGDDTFHFAHGDSGLKRNAVDTIMDFSKGDTLDLSAIDAQSKTKGDDKFTFIGTDAFGDHAGELRYEHKGHDTWVLGDTDGDGKADFKIDLHGMLTLTHGDFAL